jgi:hypothetical protein
MNAFAGVDIQLPEHFQEQFHAYSLTRTDGGRSSPEDSPFPRMVDMWFLAMSIAVKEGMKPELETSGKTYKAIEGVVFGSDAWRSNAIMLLAISHTKDIAVAERPHDMMRIANGFAIAGMPRLISILNDRGSDSALDFLSDAIVEIIKA